MKKWELNVEDMNGVMYFLDSVRYMKGNAISKYEYFLKHLSLYSDLDKYINRYKSEVNNRTLMLLKTLEGKAEPVLLVRYVLYWEYPNPVSPNNTMLNYVKVDENGITISKVSNIIEATHFSSEDEYKGYMNSYMKIMENNTYYSKY